MEPMDVDCMDSDFDNKENTFHHSNVLPCTEKGYEELDVSELNMKLRYSMTPASSPMSKSYTAYVDNRNIDTDDSLNNSNENANLTRSLNSTMTKNDSVIKSLKSLPLQSLSTETFIDGNGNASVLRQLDSTITNTNNNITVTVRRTNDIDENLSLPSASSSALHTPEATTPTKEITKDGGSPIMRGLKSVLNMFRSSQSPIPPDEGDNIAVNKLEISYPTDVPIDECTKSQAVASTPIAAHRTKEGNTPKRSSPLKDSIVFNEDLEKELNWKDETTILFNYEKIPVHKLFCQQTKHMRCQPAETDVAQTPNIEDNLNSTVEYMDVSYNDSMLKDRTLTEQLDNSNNEVIVTVESDSEFLDCETTFTKSQSHILDTTDTEDKGLAVTANVPNIGVTNKDISLVADTIVDNPLNSLDATSMSLTDGECKNDVFEQPDYSKETTKILSEMEKSGDNIISKVVLLDPNIDSKGITSEKKEYVEPKAEEPEILTNVTLKENNQNCLIETIESKENKEEKTMEENNASILQSNESAILTVPEKIIEQIQYTKTLIESDNKNTQSVLNDINEDYEGVLSDVFDTTIGSDPLTTVVNQKIMETTYIQYFNNTETQFAADSEICQSSTETPLVIPNTTVEMVSLDILDVTQNEIVPEELEILLTQEPADVPLPDDECQKRTLTSLEPLNEKQNIVIPESTCLQTEMPSDIPLPDDDDDIDKEVTGVIPVLLPDEAVHVMPYETKNAINTITELDTSESILKGLSESVDEDKSKSYDILSDSINKISSELAEEPKVFNAGNTELDSITSDIKLQKISSDSIIEKEIIPPGLGNIMSSEAKPSLLPRTLEPPHMDSASDITEIEKSLESFTETNAIEYVIMPDVVSSPDKTNEWDQTLEKIDKDMSQIVDVAQCVIDTLDTTATKENVEQTDNKHSNEPMDITINRSLNQTHYLLEVTPELTPKPLELETVDVALNISGIVKSHDDLLPEIVSSPDKTALDQTSEKIDKDICQLGHITQAVKEDIEQVENKNQNEPMDITINERLSQTHHQLEVTPAIASNILCLQTANLTSDITKNKKPLEVMTDSNVKENTILAGVASCPNNNNMILKEISEQIIVNDITQIDDLHHATNTLYTTVPNEHTQQAQTKTQDRPMNINESLNHTQDLPDLVNQTIIINEENLQNLTDAINTLTLPNEKLMVNNDNELLTTRTKGKNDRISDYEKKSDWLENDTESQNYQSTTHENQGITTDDQINAEKDSKVQSENVQSNDPECVKKNTSNDQFDKSKTTERNSTKENNMEVQVTSVDEEIIMSGNNSPYVSLMAVPEKEEKGEEKFEEIINPFVTNTPSSPPISSKGYNFNFDEMDDPFATKTKIRMSPTPDTPSKSVEECDGKKKIITDSKKEVTNLRKSQPPEKKKLVPKKKFNMSVDSTGSKMRTDKRDTKEEDNNNKTNIEINYKSSQAKVKETSTLDNTIDTTEIQEANVCKEKEYLLCTSFKERNKILPGKTENLDEKKSLTDSIPTLNEIKTTSSSEHSVNCSAGASSVESVQSKNVFNIPEIDDVNFNPFASKSKMRRSPPPDLEVENPFATKTKIGISPNTSIVISSQLNSTSSEIINETKMAEKNYEDKIETELMEKETSNTTNATTSSYDTDNQDMNTRELNTEDEDTIEGPFLDADDVHKVTDFGVDNVDMMQFNDLPTHETEDNLEGELFIDAEAFEFLLNQNKSNIVADSGKESLFLKFDPLFAKKISSDGVLAALTQVQKRQSTPTKLARPPLKNEASPIAGPSTLNVTYEGDTNTSQESNDDFNITVSKPMMVVTPAVNPAVTPRNKSITPNRSNRRSVTFASPAIAVIDRLLSMSANNSLMEQDATIIHAHREQTEANQALSQLRELLAEKEISVYNLRSESKELKDRLSTMESQMRILEADGQIRLKRINELNERLAEKTRDNKRMADVVEEYERTIASLIADTEQDKKQNAEERIKLINERDEQTAHLTSMEVSFGDLHSKYEKSKKIIRACKTNEDTYKNSIKDIGENLTKMQTNYEMLKQHATSKLNHANQELEKLNRAHEGEVVKLNAMIKRKDLHITSLEETLAQKMKANEELTAICDELINKVG